MDEDMLPLPCASDQAGAQWTLRDEALLQLAGASPIPPSEDEGAVSEEEMVEVSADAEARRKAQEQRAEWLSMFQIRARSG